MFFLKYGAFKIISAEDICLSAYGVRLNDERTKFPKNGLACFKLRRCKLKLKIIMNFFSESNIFFLIPTLCIYAGLLRVLCVCVFICIVIWAHAFVMCIYGYLSLCFSIVCMCQSFPNKMELSGAWVF